VYRILRALDYYGVHPNYLGPEENSPRRRGVRREKNFINKTPNSVTSVPLR
jgi:hypothetical protein